jgi:segregation and condensation protein A
MSDLPIATPGQKTGYRVDLPVFNGPLDLLLHLIEKEQLDITRVSLARVTDQYLEYLGALDELMVEDLTDFVVVAARLLLIKSEALLPRPPSTQQPEDADVGGELIRQLWLYKRFKEITKYLDDRRERGYRSYVRLAARPRLDAVGSDYLEPVPLEMLWAAAQRVLGMHPSDDDGAAAVRPFSITIHEQIEMITRRLSEMKAVRFARLLSDSYSRQEVAVTLMAVLELIKRQQIVAMQEQMFGEIHIHPVEHSIEPNA